MTSSDTRTGRAASHRASRVGVAWRRLWDAARHGDFTRVAIVTSRRLGMGLVKFEHMRYLKRSAWPDQGAPAAARAAGLEASKADRTDLPRLRTAFPHNARQYEARLRRGDLCVLLSRAAQPVAMTWVRVDNSRLLQNGCHIRLPSDACWIYDTFVAPAMRGYGLFHTLMSTAFNEVRRMGLSRTFLAVHHDNIVSVRAHEQAGYAPALAISTLHVGWARWHRLEWPSGEAIWRFSPEARPPRVQLA
ncbi:MAG: GNAT family N-acetyltransferase [Candidatus Polarisedimenticolia bacterium]